MRALLVASLSLALAAPAPASAEEGHAARSAAQARSAPKGARTASAAAPAAHPATPAPVPGAPVPLYPRYVYDPFFYGYAPVWWGWGWGYGYYPLYPRPRYGYAPEQVQRISTRLDLFGTATLQHGGAGVGVDLSTEGERFGVNVAFDGFDRGSLLQTGGAAAGTSTTYVHGSAHLTYAVAAGDVGRLRLELGGAFLAWPDIGPDAGLAIGGPDLGVSAQLGLLGPLALEGHARLMPVPVPVTDLHAALALRFGPAAITAGWRELAVQKSDVNAARFAFSGPQVGLGFRY